MKDLSGFGFVVVILFIFGFSILGLTVYMENKQTPEQICARQTIVQSEYCAALTEKTKRENNVSR
jgi:hypothetical protein